MRLPRQRSFRKAFNKINSTKHICGPLQINILILAIVEYTTFSFEYFSQNHKNLLFAFPIDLVFIVMKFRNIYIQM